MDMGECNRVHDLALRADFENAQKKKVGTYNLYFRLSFGLLNSLDTPIGLNICVGGRGCNLHAKSKLYLCINNL